MPTPPKEEFYWPLAALSGSGEIHDYFPEEAELLGIIAILFNRQELALKRLFLQILASKRPEYAEAIWDRQPTHKARRDLIKLALHTVRLSKRQAFLLDYILEKTKGVADRRNELLHAEYVVHGKTERLHAKIKAPGSSKAAKHQRATADDLKVVVKELDFLLDVTEGAWLEFMTRKGKALQKRLGIFAKSLGLRRESPQNGSPPQSPRRKRDARP